MMKRIYLILLLSVLWSTGFAQQPQIVITAGSDIVCNGEVVTLSTSQTYDSYEWYRADDQYSEFTSTGVTAATIDVTASGSYRVQVSDEQGYYGNVWDWDVDTKNIEVRIPTVRIGLAEGPEYNVVVGNGTEVNTTISTTRPAPWGSSRQSSYQQYLIRHGELTAMGIKPYSTIKELAFFVEDAQNLENPVNNFRIGITQTSLNELSEFIETRKFTSTFNNWDFREGDYDMKNIKFSSGWKKLPFNQHDQDDIVWDGVSSLVIKVYYNNNDQNADYSSKNSVFRMTDMGYNASCFKYDNGDIDDWSPGVGTLSSLRPNMRIRVEQNGGEDIIAACENEVILKLSGDYDDVTWSTGSNNDYIFVNGPSNQAVTVSTEDAYGCVADDEVEVRFSAFELEIATDNAEFCDGEQITLDAGENSFYLWNTGEATRTIDVDQSGIYKVEARNADGCVAQDTIKVNEIEKPQIYQTTTDILPGQEIENFEYIGEFNGHHYYKNSEWSGWSQANRIAKDVGGHLLTIENEEENNFILQKISNTNQVWLGLTDKADEGSWKWTTDESLFFENWDFNQPEDDWSDNDNRDAAVLNPWNGQWESKNTDWGYNTVLEIEYNSNIAEVICDDIKLVAVGDFSSYTWYKGTTEIGQGPTLTVTEMGDYTVVGTSQLCGLTTSEVLAITKVGSAPDMAITPSGDLCADDTQITLAATEGEGFTYHWNTGAITSSITTSEEDIFSVVVTDSDGCSASETFVSRCDMYVSPEGDDADRGTMTEPFKTIQHAIDVADEGDIIIVKDGTYIENIDFIGKNIILASEYFIDEDESHIEATIIDGDQAGTVVNFNSDNWSETELKEASLIGFTIQNGRVEMNDYDLGGGITVMNFSPTLDHLIIKNNRSRNGGGIRVQNSALNMTNILIENNVATDDGSGLKLDNIYDGANIKNIVFRENKYAWNCVIVNQNDRDLNLGRLKFENNEKNAMSIWGSWEGINEVSVNGMEISSGQNGVRVEQGNVIFKNMVATGLENEVISINNNCSVALINSTLAGNGQAARLNWGDSRLLVMNSILKNKFPKEIFVEGGSDSESKSIIITNSNIKGGEKAVESPRGAIFDLQYENNYDRFEFFKNKEEADFRLRDNSTSISAGIGSIVAFDRTFYAPLVDFDGKTRPVPEGSNVDVGAFENRSFSRKEIHHISCNGGDDGKVAVQMLAGEAPYTYLWDDIEATTDSVLYIKEAGRVYHITIVDDLGVTYQDSAWVEQPGLLELFVSDSTNVSRQGFADGSATVGVRGGNAPFNYYWEGTGETRETMNNLEANKFYGVTVTDNKGCQASTSVILEVLPVVEHDLCGFSTVDSEIQLNSTNINAIASDYDGTIWFATDQGLSSYNGKEWYSVNENANYRSIFKDKQGNLWLGSDWGEEGLVMFDGEEWHVYKAVADGLAGDNVRGITEDKYGNIWIATDYGVSRYDGYQFTNFTEKDGLVQNHTNCIFADSEGYIWVGADSGISYYKTLSETQGEEWVILNQKNDPDTQNPGETGEPGKTEDVSGIGGIFKIIEDTEGSLWFGSYWGWGENSTLIKFDREEWTRVNPELSNMSLSNVSALFCDTEGKIWVGTHEGMAMYDGSAWTSFTYLDGLSANQISTVGEDAYGNIWVGYQCCNNGLSKYNGEEWKTLRSTDGVTKDFVNALEMDHDGNLWVGTGNWESGLIKYDGTSWKVFDGEDKFNGDARDITIDENGNVWVITWNVLYKYNGELFVSYSDASGMSGDNPQKIQADGKGNIWIAYGWENKGLDRFSGNKITNFRTQDGLLSDDVNELDVDSQGNLWMTFNDNGSADGTNIHGNSGIVKYDGTNWATYNPMFGVNDSWSPQIEKLFIDSNDKVWVSAQGNIASLEGENWTYYDLFEMGYQVNYISAIGEDTEGNMWISANNWDDLQLGILKFNGTEWSVYSTDEGLPSNNILSVQDDGTGHIWFGTDNGLACYTKCASEEVLLTISGGTSCTGDGDRQLAVTPTGDSAPYQYSLDEAEFQTDSIFTGLSAGDYHLKVKNAEGLLVADREIIITEPVPLYANVEGYNATCNGLSDGAAVCIPSGGTSPYTFLWSDGITTTPRIEGLTEGVEYTVTITDVNGCTATNSIMVGHEPHLEFTDWSNVLCNGSTDGMAIITPLGGKAPFQFQWDDIEQTTDSIVTDLGAGQYYHVTVTDATGCSSVDSIILDAPQAMTAESYVYNSCGSNNAGGIELNISGGTAPYTFAWNNGSTRESLYDIAAGNYSVTVTDAGGCQVEETAAVIQYPEAVDVDITDNMEGVFCYGTTELAATAGFSEYLWSNGETTANIAPEQPGKYWVRVFNENGCSDIDSLHVEYLRTYEEQEICIVTVNEDNKNEIVWERRQGLGIDSYNIYKGTDFVENVPFNENGVFVDENSDPSARSYTYAISIVDVCGNESSTSEAHRTMLLQSNLGLGGAINLHWGKYVGLEDNGYILYRGDDSTQMEVLVNDLDKDDYMYNDNAPLNTDNQYYILEMVSMGTCDPVGLKSSLQDYSVSRSNIINTGVTGINDVDSNVEELAIYPNPMVTEVKAEFDNPNFEEYTLVIMDIKGSVIRKQNKITSNQIVIKRGDLKTGHYVVELSGGEKTFRGRIVVK